MFSSGSRKFEHFNDRFLPALTDKRTHVRSADHLDSVHFSFLGGGSIGSLRSNFPSESGSLRSIQSTLGRGGGSVRYILFAGLYGFNSIKLLGGEVRFGRLVGALYAQFSRKSNPSGRKFL